MNLPIPKVATSSSNQQLLQEIPRLEIYHQILNLESPATIAQADKCIYIEDNNVKEEKSNINRLSKFTKGSLFHRLAGTSLESIKIHAHS